MHADDATRRPGGDRSRHRPIRGRGACVPESGDASPPPPPAPPPSAPVEDDPYAANREIQARSLGGGNKDKAKFKDLASRYEARKVPKTDATILHGWRSGAIAGLVCGLDAREVGVGELSRERCGRAESDGDRRDPDSHGGLVVG